MNSKRMMEDFDQDVSEHIARETQDNIDRGMSAEEARRAAFRKFGNVAQVKEDTRGVWTAVWFERFFQDVRNGLRMMRKAPGFAAIAILTLALGIGATTAIFSVVNAVVLQPLPFPHSEQLVAIDRVDINHVAQVNLHGSESYRDFLDWQRSSTSFSSMTAYQFDDVTLTGHGEPVVLQGGIVTSGFFPTVGATPLFGRPLEAQDDIRGAGHVVVISENLWRGQLGADPNIIGKSIQLDAESFTVVGVMPANFHFPDNNPPLQLWFPVEQSPDYAKFLDEHDSNFLTIIGRLKPHVTIPEARAELNSVFQALDRQQHGAHSTNTLVYAHMESLKVLLVGDVQPILLILLGAVGLVVLIACANIANLLLARATGRTKEIAVRVALGAARGRIFRQLLTESVLLGVCGGVAGLALAYAGVAAIKSLAVDQLPHLRSISVDGWVLAFTFGLSVLAGILFGLAPAWQSSEIDLNETLRESGRSLTGSAKRRWTRNALVVVEVALAVVLLTGSGLLIKSFYLLTRTNPGFDPQHLLTADVSLPQSQYVKPEQWSNFFHDAVDRLRNLPGVEDAAAALPIPFTGSNLGYGFSIVGEPAPTQALIAQAHSVTPTYFHAMRIPLIRGREFTAADCVPNGPKLVIINQTLERKYFAHKDALMGSLMLHGITTPYPVRIVGIVGDVKDKTLADPDTSMIYLPYTQETWWVMSFVLRTKGDPTSLASAVRDQIHAMDASLPVQDVGPVTALMSSSEGDARFRSILLGLFGALALVLASVGIYSVLAYVVAQRTQELGIRIALGAQRRDVLRLVIGQGMRAVLIGVAIGLAAALALSRLLSEFLFGVGSKDPLTFAGVAVLLTLIALLACYIPARRAMRVDPIVALRYE